MPTIRLYEKFAASFASPVTTETKRFRWVPLYSGGECDIDGFDAPAIADLETLEIDNDPPALLEHNPDWICGRLENVRIDRDENGALSVACEAVIGGTEFAQAVIDYYRDGPVNLKPSIGIQRIRPYNIEKIPPGGEVRVNGQTFTGPVYVIRHGHLVEGSFVSLAGDPKALSLQASLKRNTGGNRMTFEEFLTSKEITQEMFDAMPAEEQDALKQEFEGLAGGAEADLGGDPEGGPEGGGDADEQIKEAVEEVIAEEIESMTPEEAAETFLEVCAETADELGAADGEEDDEKFKARAKRIAAKKVKAKLFRAALKKRVRAAAGRADAENRRQNAIRAYCAAFGREGGKIAGRAIAGGWSFKQTEKVMEASMAKAKKLGTLERNVPAGRDAKGAPIRQNVLTASFAMLCGLKPEYVAKHFKYDDATMNAAMERENRRVSFKRLFHESANSFRPGYANVDTSMMDILPTVRAFCRRRAEERQLNPRGFNAAMGFSTVSATDILHAVVEAYLLDTPDAAPTFYRQITKEVTFTDFNAVDSYLPTLIGQLSKISETGQIEHVSYTTEKMTAKTEPLGATFAIPEMVIINDQLSAFVALLEQLRDLPEKCVEHDVAKLFWRMVDGDVNAGDGNAFFSTARGNILTGAGTALAEAGLAAALKALDELTDANGAPLSSEGAFIVTGSSLFPTAQRLYVSENLNVVDTVGDKNVFQGQFQPYKWVYLNDGLVRAVKDNGSTASDLQTYKATQWYMFRDPARRPIMTVNKLAGYEAPQIKQYDADPSVWGTVYQLIYPYAVSPMWTDGALVMRGA